MYTIKTGQHSHLPDVAQFIESLNTLDQHPLPAVRTLFDAGQDLFVTRAPGRLDVMGGIADYSGSLVLQMPLAEATLVALQRDKTRTLQIISLGDERQDDQRRFPHAFG